MPIPVGARFRLRRVASGTALRHNPRRAKRHGAEPDTEDRTKHEVMAMRHRHFRPQFPHRSDGIMLFDPCRLTALGCILSLPPEPGRLNAAFAFDRCGRAGQLDFGACWRRDGEAKRRRCERAAAAPAEAQRRASKAQARGETLSATHRDSGQQKPASDAC
jgi:hypothetical protein